jgi:hypothetical protein
MLTSETIMDLPRFTQAEVDMLLKRPERDDWAVITVARAMDTLEVLFNGSLKPVAVVEVA